MWPLCVPIVLDTVLFFVRPYTFDALVSTWLRRATEGKLTAVLCLIGIPVAASCLVAMQLRSERVGGGAARPATTFRRLSCFLFGHRADNRELEVCTDPPTCHCGAAYLHTDGRYTRVAHTLVCFFGGHHYCFAGARDEHREYICIRCGHPLLLELRWDQTPRAGVFRKAVNYPCGLFGHRVHQVTERDAFTEYACFCGHSFLRRESGKRKIRHPLICVLLGHFIRFVGHRFGFAEFVCRNCGHPFSLACPPARR